MKQIKVEQIDDGFLGMLLSTVVASLLGSALGDKGVIRAGEVVFRAGHDF